MFSSSGKVYRSSVGGTPEVLYDGGAAHAVWSAAAKYIYFIKSNGEIWRMNNDGSDAKKIGSGTNSKFNPIAAYRPDPNALLYVSGTKFYKMDGVTGAKTEIHEDNRWYVGEVSINTAGTRLAVRDDDSDLFKIVIGGSSTEYDDDCSSSISPNGNLLTSNVSGHTQLTIHNWSGGTHKTLDVMAGSQWDNQKFAVNSNDYLVYKIEAGSTGIGINYLPDNKNTKICNIVSDYPDFFVGTLPSSGSVTPPDPPDPSNPPDPPDPPDPPPEPPSKELVVEAESMTLDGYTKEGDYIATMSSGTATATFPGKRGDYEVTIRIVKEDDGQPMLDVWFGDTMVQQLVYDLGSDGRDPENVSLGVLSIDSGALIKLSGKREGGAAARVDRITFSALSATEPPPVDPTRPVDPEAPVDSPDPDPDRDPSARPFRMELQGCVVSADATTALPVSLLLLALLLLRRRR